LSLRFSTHGSLTFLPRQHSNFLGVFQQTVNSYVAMEAAVPLSCYYPETEDLDSLMLTEPSLVRADATSPTPQFAGELGYQGYLSDFGNNPAINRASYYNAVDFWLVVGHLKPTKGNLPVNWMS